MRKIITAVDVGTTKIVALAGEKDENGKIRIIAKGTVKTPRKSVKRGVVLNIEVVSEAIQRAIKLAEEESDIKFKKVFVGIAGQHIQNKKVSHSIFIGKEGRLINQKDIDKMISEVWKFTALEPGQEIIDVIPMDFKVDLESGVTHPVGMYGKKLEGLYNVIIGEKTSTKNIKRCFELIGIKPENLYLEPIASAKAVLSEDEKEAGVALVDIGGGTTDLAVFHDGILIHTAVIPFGGDIITYDIKDAYKILNRYSEILKTEYGTALSEFADKNSTAIVPGINGRESKEINLESLSKIIQSRMTEIIKIINYEMRTNKLKDKLGAGIVLTGGGALLKKIKPLTAFHTGLDVKISKPSSSMSSAAARVSSPKLSTATGLIMLGFEDADTYDFIVKKPDSTKKRKKRNNKQSSKKEKSIIKIINDLTGIVKQTTLDFFNEEDIELDD